MKVRPFQRTTEPSFPENEMLPKKKEDEKKFDKRFEEWWDDVKLNLARLDDQMSKYIKADLNESINTNKKETQTQLANLDESTQNLLNNVNSTLQNVKDNLYSM